MSLVSAKQAGLAGFTKYRSLADASGNPAFNIPGMVLMKPTSIAHSGTSATLGANGQVTFTAVTELNINGCFTADFDNYQIAIRLTSTSNGARVNTRLRTSGSDASGSNYTQQILEANGSATPSGSRATTTYAEICIGYTAVAQNASWTSVYGPFLAQPTAYRSVSAYSFDGAYIQEAAGTHSLSTSYDGVTLYPSTGNLTGTVAVYGIRS